MACQLGALALNWDLTSSETGMEKQTEDFGREEQAKVILWPRRH